AATVAVFLVGGLGALTLSRASGVDGKSTFFASIPGGAMAMAVLAERYGAQVAPVAVAHSLRVSIVVILIPLALSYGGIPLVGSAFRPNVPLDYRILALWLGFGFVSGEVSERLRLQNGYLLAPIFFGAALTVSGVQLSAVPHWMIDFAQLMFGLVLGARYERVFFVLPAVHTFRVVELVLYRNRLGGGRCGAGLGFRPAYRYDDPGDLARRLGGDDDHRPSPPDQRAIGGRLPLVSGGRGQHGHPVHLRRRRSVVGREEGHLEDEVLFKVQGSMIKVRAFYSEL